MAEENTPTGCLGALLALVAAFLVAMALFVAGAATGAIQGLSISTKAIFQTIKKGIGRDDLHD
jgi:hypothetical protein